MSLISTVTAFHDKLEQILEQANQLPAVLEKLEAVISHVSQLPGVTGILAQVLEVAVQIPKQIELQNELSDRLKTLEYKIDLLQETLGHEVQVIQPE